MWAANSGRTFAPATPATPATPAAPIAAIAAIAAIAPVTPASSAAASGPVAGWLAQEIGLPGGGTLKARLHGSRLTGRPTPLVLHFHGGAFVGGSLDSGAAVAQLLAAAGSIVLSIDYPLAPAHPFPAAAEAGHAAALWLHRNRRRLGGGDSAVLLAGEEAGGNLAAAVALMARDRQRPPLAGQILLSPMLDPCLGTASLRQADLDSPGCPWARGWANYLSRVADAAHPYAAPANCLRLAQLAPTMVVTAADDPMRDEALAFAARLREAGVAVEQALIRSETGWPQAYWQAATTATEPGPMQEPARVGSTDPTQSPAPRDWSRQLRERLQRFIAARRIAASPKGDSRS